MGDEKTRTAMPLVRRTHRATCWAFRTGLRVLSCDAETSGAARLQGRRRGRRGGSLRESPTAAGGGVTWDSGLRGRSDAGVGSSSVCPRSSPDYPGGRRDSPPVSMRRIGAGEAVGDDLAIPNLLPFRIILEFFGHM